MNKPLKQRLLVFSGLVTLFFTNLSYGQNLNKDSLALRIKHFEQNISEYKSNEEYINLLNLQAVAYRYFKADSLYAISQRALQLSQDSDNQIGQIKALANIGQYYSDKGLSHEAIPYYNKAISLCNSLEHNDLKVSLINDLALEYSYKGNYEKAMRNFLIGLDIAKEIEDKYTQSIITGNISGLYYSQKEFSLALEFTLMAKKINEELGDELVIAETLSNIASIYTEMKEFDLAMFNINKSISIFERNEVYEWLAFAYSVKGNIYLMQEKFKWALYWFDQSKHLHKRLEDPRAKMDLFISMSDAYLGIEDYSLAETHVCDAFELASWLRSIEGNLNVSKIRYKISKHKGDFENALRFHETFQLLNDSIYQSKNRKSLILAKTKMQYDKDKALLIATNEKELAKQRNFNNAIIVIIVIILGAATPLYFSQKKLKRLYQDLKVNTKNLRESQTELNTINSTKDKLFSIIGHDLRGPIGALQGLLKLMVSGEIEKDDFSKLLPKLRGDVDHILFTLNNLLSWGYSQMNGMVTKPKMVNFNHLVKSNINFLSEMAGMKGIKIIDDLPEHCLIHADENQVDIVVRNLISNAIKFTPDNGLITLDATEMASHWKINIRDTGIGMDEKTRKKIFRENSNITTYGTNNEKGTGLGLSLCKEMVENNNGKIWVESAPQKGSTFFFTLPKIVKKYRQAG